MTPVNSGPPAESRARRFCRISSFTDRRARAGVPNGERLSAPSVSGNADNKTSGVCRFIVKKRSGSWPRKVFQPRRTSFGPPSSGIVRFASCAPVRRASDHAHQAISHTAHHRFSRPAIIRAGALAPYGDRGPPRLLGRLWEDGFEIRARSGAVLDEYDTAGIGAE